MYVPELALIRFVIEDHDSTSDNEFIAQYTLPLNSLKMGESDTSAPLSSRFIKGLWWNRGPASASAQSLLRFFISRLFCVPTQDTGTCLWWTRTGAFCPQLASLCTPWSWRTSEMPPSAYRLFYPLLNGGFSPFFFLLLSRFSL